MGNVGSGSDRIRKGGLLHADDVGARPLIREINLLAVLDCRRQLLLLSTLFLCCCCRRCRCCCSRFCLMYPPQHFPLPRPFQIPPTAATRHVSATTSRLHEKRRPARSKFDSSTNTQLEEEDPSGYFRNLTFCLLQNKNVAAVVGRQRPGLDFSPFAACRQTPNEIWGGLIKRLLLRLLQLHCYQDWKILPNAKSLYRHTHTWCSFPSIENCVASLRAAIFWRRNAALRNVAIKAVA